MGRAHSPQNAVTGAQRRDTATVSAQDPANWQRHLLFQLDALTEEHAQDMQEACEGVLAHPVSTPPAPEPPLYTPWADADKLLLPLNAPHLIGLTGAPRSGKDVVAEYLVARYRGVERLAFSDPIVQEANDYLACYRDENGASHRIVFENKSEPQFRRLLQAWGLGRRDEDQHYWTQRVDQTVRRLQGAGAQLVLSTGVRMPTDMDLIDGLGGRTWRVVRPGNDYEASHAVEAGLVNVPDSKFVDIINPIEGNLEAYEANIEARLRGETQPYPRSIARPDTSFLSAEELAVLGQIPAPHEPPCPANDFDSAMNMLLRQGFVDSGDDGRSLRRTLAGLAATPSRPLAF